MKNIKIAFIGAGNMAASLIAGLIQNDFKPQNILATNIEEDKLQELKHKYSIHVSTKNHEGVKFADVIVLCVKPQLAKTICDELAKEIQAKKPLIISILAGMPISFFQKNLGSDLAIIRCMPNTPALLGCGVTGLFANKYVSDAQKEIANKIIHSVGKLEWFADEKLLDAVTAISGSGPAYFFLFMEAMKNTAIKLGIDDKAAQTLVTQTCLGAARMSIETGISLEDLRKQVTSPKGTTEKAINTFEELKLRDIVEKSLTAARDRAEELGK